MYDLSFIWSFLFELISQIFLLTLTNIHWLYLNVLTPEVSQPTPLKRNLVPRLDDWIEMGKWYTWGGAKETRIMLIKIILRLPGGFFFSVMRPLNFIHFYHLSTSTSLFLIQNSEWIFGIWDRAPLKFLVDQWFP